MRRAKEAEDYGSVKTGTNGVLMETSRKAVTREVHIAHTAIINHEAHDTIVTMHHHQPGVPPHNLEKGGHIGINHTTVQELQLQDSQFNKLLVFLHGDKDSSRCRDLSYQHLAIVHRLVQVMRRLK